MKALWSIRNLSKNTQMIYSKNLRRLARASTVEKRLREHTGLLSSLTVPSLRLESFRFTGLTT